MREENFKWLLLSAVIPQRMHTWIIDVEYEREEFTYRRNKLKNWVGSNVDEEKKETWKEFYL